MTVAVFVLLIPALISYYTFTFGIWAWKQDFKAGSVGVFLLALLTFLFPAYAVFFIAGL